MRKLFFVFLLFLLAVLTQKNPALAALSLDPCSGWESITPLKIELTGSGTAGPYTATIKWSLMTDADFAHVQGNASHYLNLIGFENSSGTNTLQTAMMPSSKTDQVINFANTSFTRDPSVTQITYDVYLTPSGSCTNSDMAPLVVKISTPDTAPTVGEQCLINRQQETGYKCKDSACVPKNSGRGDNGICSVENGVGKSCNPNKGQVCDRSGICKDNKNNLCTGDATCVGGTCTALDPSTGLCCPEGFKDGFFDCPFGTDKSKCCRHLDFGSYDIVDKVSPNSAGVTGNFCCPLGYGISGWDCPFGTDLTKQCCKRNGFLDYTKVDKISCTLAPVCQTIATPPPAPCASNMVNGVCAKLNTGLGDIGTTPSGLIKSIFGIVLSISGGIAILLIIISGYKILSSQGNPEVIKDAKEQLTAAIVGLLFIILSLVILQVIGVDILRIPGFG